MTHKKNLIDKIAELKGSGIEELGALVDSVYAYHCDLFFCGSMQDRIIFNLANGLSKYARPEESIAIIWDLVEREMS